jgi:hypothetical protein
MARTKIPREEWANINKRYEESGLSQTAFCAANSLSLSFLSTARQALGVQHMKGGRKPNIARVTPTYPGMSNGNGNHQNGKFIKFVAADDVASSKPIIVVARSGHRIEVDSTHSDALQLVLNTLTLMEATK